MGFTMTKRWCSLENESLDMLMRISNFKESLDMDVKELSKIGAKHRTEEFF